MHIAKRILGLVLVLIGLAVSVAVAGRSTLITCRWIETVRVDCTTQPAPLGIAWGEGRSSSAPPTRSSLRSPPESISS